MKNVTKKIKIQASTPYAKVYSHKIANKAFRYFESCPLLISTFQVLWWMKYQIHSVWTFHTPAHCTVLENDSKCRIEIFQFGHGGISQITPRDIRLDQKDIDTHKLYCM